MLYDHFSVGTIREYHYQLFRLLYQTVSASVEARSHEFQDRLIPIWHGHPGKIDHSPTPPPLGTDCSSKTKQSTD